VVPKYKHSGVERNRLKRRLRELARTRLLPTLPPIDVVIRSRPEAYAASFDALARQVDRAGAQLRRMLRAPESGAAAEQPPAP
jgi:ribonuclease P protein component